MVNTVLEFLLIGAILSSMPAGLCMLALHEGNKLYQCEKKECERNSSLGYFRRYQATDYSTRCPSCNAIALFEVKKEERFGWMDRAPEFKKVNLFQYVHFLWKKKKADRMKHEERAVDAYRDYIEQKRWYPAEEPVTVAGRTYRTAGEAIQELETMRAFLLSDEYTALLQKQKKARDLYGSQAADTY